MIAITLFVVAALGNAAKTSNCEKAQTQLEMNQCAQAKKAQTDKRLNDVYRRYRQRLQPAHKQKLTDAQRAWLAFRESWCSFIASGAEGGTVQPLVLSECLRGVTEQRIKQLEQVSSCKEGESGCP